MKIYLDNCCYNRPYDDQSQFKINLEALAKLEVKDRIRQGKIELAASYVLIAENSANRFESKRRDIQAFIDEYTHTYISYKSSADVNAAAEEIMKTGIQFMDACHIACAILAGCDYFLTTDKKLLKYQTNRIKIANPVTFIVEKGE